MKFEGMLDRFLAYVKIDTQSDESSDSFPSTKNQFDLENRVAADLKAIGIKDATVNKWGYVFGTLESNIDKDIPTIALIAHMDTAPDVSGKGVLPIITENYNGADVVLSERIGKF